MMRPEDYTGSDTSGRIARVFSEAVRILEDEGVCQETHFIEQVEQAFSLERDPNWKGFAAGLIGMLEEAQHDLDAAESWYQQALAHADATLSTFDDTLYMYGYSAYYLGVIRFDKEAWPAAAEAFLHCIPWLDQVFEDIFRGNILSFLALALLESGRVREAVPFARAAVSVRGGEEGAKTILRKCEEALKRQ